MSDKNIERMDAAWAGFEAAVQTLGQQVRDASEGDDARQRYERYRAGLAMIAENYVNQLYSDPARPEWIPSVGSLFNYAGPAPDFIYNIVNIEPGESYRFWGRRGDCELIDLQFTAGWYGKSEDFSVRNVANELFDERVTELDADGNFEIILSPKRAEGQWWPLDESVTTIMIREYFTDYKYQHRPSEFHLDKLGVDQGATRSTLDVGVTSLEAMARSLRDYAYTLALPKVVEAKVGSNQFHEFNFDDAGGSVNHRYLQVRWDIAADEALVGRWRFPESIVNWSLALYNDAYQVLNYANRQVNINPGSARIDDGELIFVLSHVDPGVANWLDLDGHDKGQMLMRTKNASAFDVPVMQKVKLSELESLLPSATSRVTPAQRAADLAVRRQHFQLRERR